MILRPLTRLTSPLITLRPSLSLHLTSRPFSPSPHSLRHLSSKSPADTKLEHIQDLYATAKDEFEIASEETSKKTVYAADDRAAAREELEKLQGAFKAAVEEGEGGEEVRRRVGGRVRELENAVQAMEESAKED